VLSTENFASLCARDDVGFRYALLQYAGKMNGASYLPAVVRLGDSKHVYVSPTQTGRGGTGSKRAVTDPRPGSSQGFHPIPPPDVQYLITSRQEARA
jgi:hypothetical protein